MKPFRYVRPKSVQEAAQAISSYPNALFIAGGTNLIDLMKRGIVSPETLVDINQLPLRRIEAKAGLLRIGGLALNSDVAAHRLVLDKHPLLALALNAGASGQLRNMATVGGNILQQTRCPYFYDSAFACNKRAPGTGCAALEGINRMHAIFGLSKIVADNSCIAVHPSDMCVALMALDATVLVYGSKGERVIPISDFYQLRRDRPDLGNDLASDELIVAVDIPDNSFSKHVYYLKVRDRASYAFATVSVAAVLEMDQNRIKSARLTMGGVAYKPWRMEEAESILQGQPASESLFRQAAEVFMREAVAFKHNAYKLKLAPNAIVQALKMAAGIS